MCSDVSVFGRGKVRVGGKAEIWFWLEVGYFMSVF